MKFFLKSCRHLLLTLRTIRTCFKYFFDVLKTNQGFFFFYRLSQNKIASFVQAEIKSRELKKNKVSEYQTQVNQEF